MGGPILQTSASELWALAKRQHGIVARWQLLELGFNRRAIEHRIAKGRLHPVWRGVYVVGRPELTREGRWMAAVLACGTGAVLSHVSAAVLWEIRPKSSGPIHVTLIARRSERPGIVAHRRTTLTDEDITQRLRIPVTTPITTLIDNAPSLSRDELEAAINEADKRNLVDPETLRAALDGRFHRPGAAALRSTLDRRTFTLTESELERRFLPLARRAGLPAPKTGVRVNGYKVDFYWPDLKLVVETDGLTYHRTPAQQARDRLRDQTHSAAGLTPLRFTRAQVKFEPDHVRTTLAAVARRLR
jgi:very-short-patch-repair endonuclease